MPTLLILLPLLLQDTPPEGPSPETVRATVERIETALAAEEREPKLAALMDAREVPAPEVVDALTGALGDDDLEVVDAAIQGLRWNRHADALETLHRTAKRNRALRKDDDRYAALLKAIGQHADPSSIDVLAKDVFGRRHYGTRRACILGLGRIRDPRALSELLDLMKGAKQETVDLYAEDFRLSLIVLTGTDQGPSSAAWQRWWKENRKTFELSPTLPRLPRAEHERWTVYWGLPRDYGRAERREDRGGRRRNP